ncbi:MAG: GNAT family N-acetyltransferase [Deltaproteobacteria bacterium]|nr:GNAT family N-acetyltransferase [Deltaproteobacteria bacterium]
MRRAHIGRVVEIMLHAEPWQSYDFSPDRIADYLGGMVDAGMARVLAVPDAGHAPAGEEIAGVCIVQPSFLGGRFLEILALDTPYRRRGLGRAILEAICDECPPQLRDYFVLVAGSNANAVAFYKRLGFVDVGDLPGLIRPDKVERLIWWRFR